MTVSVLLAGNSDKMSEPKLTKPRQRSTRKKAPATDEAHQEAASAQRNGSVLRPWPNKLLCFTAIAIALIATVFYGTTTFNTQSMELNSFLTSKLFVPCTHMSAQWAPASLACTGLREFVADGTTTTDQLDVDSINNIEGIFPKGCQWRDVQYDGRNKKFWSEEDYEYWHGDVKQWKSEMPNGCNVRGKPAKR